MESSPADKLVEDEFWAEYQKASRLHGEAMDRRREAERQLVELYSAAKIEQWDMAHREEDRCYEDLKAAERVVWAKFKGSTSI